MGSAGAGLVGARPVALRLRTHADRVPDRERRRGGLPGGFRRGRGSRGVRPVPRRQRVHATPSIRPLFGADKPSAKPPPDWVVKLVGRLHPEMRRREKRAADRLANPRFRQVLAEWTDTIRPGVVAQQPSVPSRRPRRARRRCAGRARRCLARPHVRIVGVAPPAPHRRPRPPRRFTSCSAATAASRRARRSRPWRERRRRPPNLADSWRRSGEPSRRRGSHQRRSMRSGAPTPRRLGFSTTTSTATGRSCSAATTSTPRRSVSAPRCS